MKCRSVQTILPAVCVTFFLGFANVAFGEDEESQPKKGVGYNRREYSMGRPLTGGSTTQYWQISGAAMLTDEHVRLTPDEQSKSGAVWGMMPCFIRDWEVHIQTKVHGHNSRFYGDGLAFWYTSDRNQVGPVFGSKDLFKGLALFFDTYANQNGEHAHEHPYVSAQINNGSASYDHDRDGTHTELDGCTSHFRGTDHETHFSIRYIGSKNRLTVQYDVENEGKWTQCLDRFGVHLPTGYYFGFSASTGDLSDHHDILSVKFYELDSAETASDQEVEDFTKIIPHAKGAEEERPHSEDLPATTRSQRVFNWFIGIVVVILIAGVLGFLYYQKYQRDQLKRFY